MKTLHEILGRETPSEINIHQTPSEAKFPHQQWPHDVRVHQIIFKFHYVKKNVKMYSKRMQRLMPIRNQIKK